VVEGFHRSKRKLRATGCFSQTRGAFRIVI
jgi:hypothetical protein